MKEDVPFMNYRVWICSKCGKVVSKRDYNVTSLEPTCCDKCGNTELYHAVNGGMKWCLLMWDEVPV